MPKSSAVTEAGFSVSSPSIAAQDRTTSAASSLTGASFSVSSPSIAAQDQTTSVTSSLCPVPQDRTTHVTASLCTAELEDCIDNLPDCKPVDPFAVDSSWVSVSDMNVLSQHISAGEKSNSHPSATVDPQGGGQRSKTQIVPFGSDGRPGRPLDPVADKGVSATSFAISSHARSVCTSSLSTHDVRQEAHYDMPSENYRSDRGSPAGHQQPSSPPGREYPSSPRGRQQSSSPPGRQQLSNPPPSASSSSKHQCESSPSAGKKEKKRLIAWTAEEHQRFLFALEKLRTEDTEAIGADGERTKGLGPGIAEVIALAVGSRSAAQVRSHAQKYFTRQRKEKEM